MQKFKKAKKTNHSSVEKYACSDCNCHCDCTGDQPNYAQRYVNDRNMMVASLYK